VAQLSRTEIEQILARDLQGYRLVEPPADIEADLEPAARLPPEADTPDLETLRRKFLGQAAAAPAPPISQELSAQPDVEDAIVTVVPESAGDPSFTAAQPKTVVISGKEKRVIGTQG
jgi:hypothetical protein